jgi:membrane protease YdiL (CAAX protease family)
MSAPRQRDPIPFPRVTFLIAALFLRRFGNRITAGFWRRKQDGARSGVGRKAIGNPLGLVAIFAIFIFNTASISSEAIKTVSTELGPTHDGAGRVELRRGTYNTLQGSQGWVEAGSTLHWKHHVLGVVQDEKEARLQQIFENETEAANPASRADYGHALALWYEKKGIAGFVPFEPSQRVYWVPELRAWHDPVLRPVLLNAFGLILLIMAGARHCWTLGSRNQDLGQVEWGTEWLFNLPASSRSLFGAQILGHAFVDPFAWMGAIPLLLVIYISSGVAWPAALGAALCNSLYLSLIMASLRVTSETWLRKRLTPARLKNLQALFTVVGIVLLFMLFALARSQEVAQWVIRMAAHRLPLLIWNPLSIPAGAFFLPLPVFAAWEIAAAAGITVCSIALCAWLVRDGLISAPAAYSGDRGPARAGDLLPAGIIGKDLRLLLRDRNFFVQTLVAPALIVLFQIIFNVGMAQSIGSNFHHAATFAFAVGAYVMISTSLNVLAVEGNSLWMLYGLPVTLPAIMLRKTMLWAALGVCYAIVVLGICAWHIHSFENADISYATVALAGVLIYSFIAAGMGMLGTDPLEVEVKRRISPGMIYLYMILATLYGYALYAPSTWARLGQIVLSSLLAFALWQKVRDRSPFLLDAVSMPPPRVSLADGLMAALAFFVLQGVLSLFFLSIQVRIGKTIVLAFAGAGALVVGFTLLMFWRARVAGVLAAVGLAGPRDGRRARAVALGLCLGLVAGGAAFVYLKCLRSLPDVAHLSRRAEELTLVRGWWLVLLAVVAAPLFEEFIFRGLVFRGLRRSLPARWSIAGSAAVFAICHPPVSVIPVFIMGSLAALGFEWTGWIVTPICVHMTYNGLVLLSGMLAHAGRL